MKRWYLWLVMLLVATVFVVACSDEDDTPPIMGQDAPPTIGFLSVGGVSPQSNTTLRVPPQFRVVLNPTARGGKSIARVELNVNGINLPSKTSAPWEFEVDFGDISTTGPAIISAIAVDSAGLRSAPATQQVIVDATPPTVTITAPEEGAVISGAIAVSVTATDTGAGVRAIQVFFDGEEVDAQIFNEVAAEQTFETTIPVTLASGVIADGQHVITARAFDGIGNVGASAERTIVTRNQGAPAEPPEVSLDVTRFEPTGQPITGCTASSCYQGTVNVPVNVEDDFGDAVVRLIVQSPLGTQALGPISSFPYTFRLDTTSYPDNSELTLIAEGSAPNGSEVNRSEPVAITVFNDSRLPVTILQSAIEPAPQPIAGCSSPQCYRGSIRVPVAIQDAEGSSIVRLFVEGPLGTQILGPITEFPYIFEFDSTIYPDNSQLTLTAERRQTQDDDASLSSPVTITVFNSDTTPPELTFVQPVDGATVAGTIRIEISATDLESGIRNITVRFEDDEVASETYQEAEQTQTLVVRRNPVGTNAEGEEIILQDGDYEITAVVVNDVGVETEQTITITTQNVGSPPAPPDPPVVRVDDIEPPATTPQPTECDPTLTTERGQTVETTGCFSGTITVPVLADNASGNSQVRLLITSELFGTFPVDEILTDPPFIFSINTLDFQNNDSLTLRAEITDLDTGLSSLSDPAYITVFNRATPPRLVITSPSPDGVGGGDAGGDAGDDAGGNAGGNAGGDALAGVEVSGDLFVTVSVNSLTGSGYSLDLDNDGRVEASDSIEIDSIDGDSQAEQQVIREGVIIELIDFTNEVVAERRLDFLAGVQPTTSGSYTTPNPINTVLLSNDVYTLQVIVYARFEDTGEVIGLVRSLAIQTRNRSVVAPALLILFPNDQNGTLVRTIRDPDNAYVLIQATDDTEGIQFFELRVFSGIPNDDNTPSRFIQGFETPLPLNPPSQALPINYNADPFLPDSSTLGENQFYTVRITAEDGAGNRTFQDVRVQIERNEGSGVVLSASTNPVIIPTGTNAAFVNLNVTPFGDVTLSQGTLYNYLTPGLLGLQPLFEDSAITSPSPSIAQAAGTYRYIVQATTPEGEIYTSDSLFVQVVNNTEPTGLTVGRTINAGSSVNFSVNQLALDPNVAIGDTLEIVSVSDPVNGSLTVSPTELTYNSDLTRLPACPQPTEETDDNGNVVIIPPEPAPNVTDSFGVTIADDFAGVGQATVNVTIIRTDCNN